MSAGARWLGFHLFAPGPVEPFLVGCLAPLQARAEWRARVRRCFFLRYSEGGAHLRLRVLPRPGVAPADVLALLDREVRTHADAAGGKYRLEEHPYDRTRLYFGETPCSVYAELLNVQTSRLCLGLLGAPGGEDRTRIWLGLASLLDVLLRGAADDAAGYLDAVSESRAFAARAAADLGLRADEPDLPANGALDARVLGAMSRIAGSLRHDASVRRTVRLLRRTRRVESGGGFVATHALHLLCNKLGFSLRQEEQVFATLHRLASGSGPESRTEPRAAIPGAASAP